MSDAELSPRAPSGRLLWRRLAKSLARVCGVVAAILAPSACYVMQPCGSSAPARSAADPDALREQVRALAMDFGPRYYNRPENLVRCRDFISRSFRECGAVVEEQRYTTHLGEFRNVRAFFGDRSLPRLVVGAHYDACEESREYINRGADDNASGVAGLLGLARLLQRERPTGTAVELVAYCTEEPPFFSTHDMGSYRHAEALKNEGADIKGVLVLEMIGYYSDAPGSQHYPVPLLKLFYPSRGNFISLVGGVGDRPLIATAKKAMKGSTPLPVWSVCAPRSMDSIHLSDHRNYWPFGFQALMVTDTALYRNANYHQAGDVWQTLDYTRMAQAVTGVHQAVLRLGAVTPSKTRR